MTEKTKTALADALEAHAADRAAAALSGQHPDEVDSAEVEDAAKAHLASVDPGYADREAGKAPHDRVEAPKVKEAYDAAQAAHEADPDDAGKAAEAARLGDLLASARQAARVAEGRWTTTAVTPDEEG